MSSKKDVLLTPIMRWFMFAMVLANISGRMFPMLVPIHLASLGASIEQVGIIFTTVSVVAVGLQLIGGWVSDSIGRLKAIAIGSIGGIIGFGAILLAPTWEWMLLALALNQLPYALVGPSFGAFIAENSTEENRGQVFGLTTTIYQITGIIGPPLGGFLAGWFSFKTMMLAAFILYAGAAGLRIWMATTMKSSGEQPVEALSRASFKANLKTVFSMIAGGGVITWLFLTDGVRDIAFRLSGELQPLYLDQIAGISAQQIGLLGGIFSVAMIGIPMIAGRMSDKYGERVPISLGFLMIFVAMMLFLNMSSFIGFALVWVVFGLGSGMLQPAYQSLISKVVPKNKLGIFNGVFYGSLGLISLPAPYIGARLWETYSPQLPFLITAIAALVTIIPTWFFFKVPDKPKGQTPKLSDDLVPAKGTD